ncbi:transcriptional repressor [Yinghuangia sp. ASG 101]|nr:transcriptional repressor [Yinghuangia sp. ASG 101]
MAEGEFLSARRLHRRLAQTGSNIGLSTVYRALHDLVRLGSVDVVRDETGERLYRHRLANHHRHYLLCRQCGHSRALDAGPVERWADGVAARTGFVEIRHTVELTGICVACVTANRLPPEGR